ncbi:MAG TPA: ATP-binding protein [Umezawaea sp.]|nr:ATP-binding protein [Umezawaea sp.]
MTILTIEDDHEFDLGLHRVPPLSRIRAWIRENLPDVHDDVVIDVELVATELTTNAYDHAEGPHCLRLSHQRARGTVRVEVDDGSTSSVPRGGASTLSGPRGRGLKLVESISTAWGTQVHPGHKTVWAVIPTLP